MAKHRDQAKFDRAGWRLKVLLPSWAVQISLLIILISTSAYLFSKAINQSVEVRGTAIAWECTNIGISVIALLLTAYEILRTVTEGLTPKTMLVTNLVKLFGGVLCMIMDGMVTGTSLDGWSDGTLVTHGLLMMSILVSSCYAAWKWKRLAQYDEYHHPGNVKPFGFNADLKQKGFSSHTRILSDDLDWDVDLEMGNNVEIISGAASPGVMAPSPGETTPRTPGRDRGSSFAKVAGRMNFSLTSDVDAANAEAGAGRARADTESSLMAVDTAYDPAAVTAPRRPASYVSATGSGADRRASYNHARDPAFDEYVTRRQEDLRRAGQRASSGSSASWASSTTSASASGGGSPATSPPAAAASSSSSSRARSGSAAAYRLSLNLKSDVDDALGAGFGWGAAAASRSSSSQDGSDAAAVGGGVVPSARSVRDSMGRAPSDGSERGALGIVPGSGEDGAGGDDVDDVDDVDDGGGPDRRRRNLDEASRALLGEGREDGPGGHPQLLRPGRPKSEIEFVITPPPPKSPGPNPRSTWGNAYSNSR